MKKIVFSLVLLAFVVFGTKGAFAYGGGGGFPPGYYNNPNAHHGLVCEWVTKQLPNGKKIVIPSCHVVHNTESQVNKNSGKNDQISYRMKGFFNRLRFGR